PGLAIPGVLHRRFERLGLIRESRLAAPGLGLELIGDRCARVLAALGDGEIPGDLGEVRAVVRLQRKTVRQGQTVGALAGGAVEVLADVGAEDRHRAALADTARDRAPFLELILFTFTRETRLVPEAPALEPQIERRHPGVGPVAHGAAGHGEGAVDPAVFPELDKEDRDRLLYGLHA